MVYFTPEITHEWCNCHRKTCCPCNISTQCLSMSTQLSSTTVTFSCLIFSSPHIFDAEILFLRSFPGCCVTPFFFRSELGFISRSMLNATWIFTCRLKVLRMLFGQVHNCIFCYVVDPIDDSTLKQPSVATNSRSKL